LVPQIERLVDGCHALHGFRRVEGGSHCRIEQGDLVGEHPEDGPLGDPCGLGHLGGGDTGTMLEEEGYDRLENGMSAALAGERFGALPLRHDSILD
jgi:hypothetical protein